MAKLYSNENFPFPVVEELRRLGHDVLTVLEAGKAEQAIPDDAVLAYAKELERVILTINRKHFKLLHNTQPNHAGIIICTFDADFVRQAERINEVLKTEADVQGKLLRVNRPAAAE